MRSAVSVAAAAGLDSPIKVIWSREEDMTHGRYRPQSVTRFRAMLGADGMPVAFESKIAMPSILVSMAEQALDNNGIDWTSIEVINSAPYKIPNYYVGQALKNMHVPVTFWRSVGGSQNTFFMESFIDELAHAAGEDPLAYRRAMVDRPDFLLVIDKLAEKSNWGAPLPKGRGRGVAVAQRKYLVDGSVAEITVSNSGDIHVDRVITAYDFSRTVNPSIVEAQIQGAIHWALSGMFYGEITIKDGTVEQRNFDSYDMVRLAQAPAVEVYEVQTGRDEWGGVGELGATSVVAAVANAIFAVTGTRVRKLPLMNIDRKDLVPA